MSDKKPFLRDLCQPKGIQVISCCKSRKFLEHILQQDLLFFSTSQKDDILFIGLLCNIKHIGLTTKEIGFPALPFTFYLLYPAILSDQHMDNLVCI